jgi:hypothetical protein
VKQNTRIVELVAVSINCLKLGVKSGESTATLQYSVKEHDTASTQSDVCLNENKTIFPHLKV